jgi:hypothetical protein
LMKGWVEVGMPASGNLDIEEASWVGVGGLRTQDDGEGERDQHEEIAKAAHEGSSDGARRMVSFIPRRMRVVERDD